MTAAINKILIYGYGVMGQAVSGTFAEAGFDVHVVSSRANALAGSADPVTFHENLPTGAPDLVPDLVIEFVPENYEDKQAVYREIEAAYGGATLIASGTSGLDLVKLADGLAHAERFLGVHYFMPAESTAVVEVMAGPSCPREDVDAVSDAMKRTGKETVVLYSPVVGFLINRLQHIILHECYYLMQNGVAGPDDIDMSARLMLGPRMCLNGLVQQKDISGLKIHADAQRSIVPELYPVDTPNPMIQDMVSRGEGGLGDGKGFYDWSGMDVGEIRARAGRRLRKLTEFLRAEAAEEADAPEPRPRSREELLGE
ncbi:MAG: 3-hydroxyacyl-CoA dehydrogenase NAD-binding domain-containing protein [Alphaproteobacteria bacterium]|nr:3-hydroxyacyl-CoA dehydrogenase NAD-binding domain-containing protein [Alphaproteobacteria bacterium]